MIDNFDSLHLLITSRLPFLGEISSNNNLVLTLAIEAVVVIILYFLLFYILRWWFRQFENDIALVTLGVSRLPALIIATCVGLKIALLQLESATPEVWFEKGLDGIIWFAATFWIGQIFTRVFVYYLKEFAEQSEAMWDDVLIPIFESTIPFFIYLVGTLFGIQALGVKLTALWAAIGGATFVLGFAAKDILANFFSGLVLLVDTPFRFGDVIMIQDGVNKGASRAIIQRIGLRGTLLHLIDTHADLYIPNAAFEKQKIVNLNRPTSHFYYNISVPVASESDPGRVEGIIKNVALAHPDTLGATEDKIRLIDDYYGYAGNPEIKEQKKVAARQRLCAEQSVNGQLAKVEQALDQLSDKIGHLEKGGLDNDELRTIQRDYVEICEMLGLEVMTERKGRRKRSSLVEMQGMASEEAMIGLVRKWYRSWLQDPDLIKEDHQLLPKQWEQNIGLLKLRSNKIFRKITNPAGEETRLDDYIDELQLWVKDNFKSSRNEWQEPKIWVENIKALPPMGSILREYNIRFYVDDIRLEHCQRGNRVESEVRQEIIWHLRKEYLYK